MLTNYFDDQHKDALIFWDKSWPKTTGYANINVEI